MKKIYKQPQIAVVKVAQSLPIAESYIISNAESDYDAMSKDEGDWDEVWDD